MTIQHVKAVLDRVHHAHKLLLISIADFAGKDGICHPAIRTLAVRIGRSYERTRKILGELERDGFIKRIYRFDPGGRQTANGYQLLLEDEPKPSATVVHPPVTGRPPHEEPPIPPPFVGTSRRSSQVRMIVEGSYWLNRGDRPWQKRHPGSGVVAEETAGSYRARVEQGGRWFDLGTFPTLWEAHDRYVAATQHVRALFGGKIGREVLP